MTRRETETAEVVLSASSISTFLSCPQRWFYRYRERIEPIRKDPNLERGSAIHAAVQAWWNGRSVSDAMRKWLASTRARMLAGEFQGFVEDWERIRQLIDRYVAHYGSRPPVGQVLGTEVELSYQIAPGLRVLGYVDLVYVDAITGGVRALEIKSSRGLKRRMTYLDWDQQPVSYDTGLRTMGFDTIEGILWDGISTYPYKNGLAKVDDDKLFQRQFIETAETQRAEFLENCRRVVEQIRTADRSGFVRNLGAQCNTCDFRDICHAEVIGDELRAAGARRTHFRKRTPYG